MTEREEDVSPGPVPSEMDGPEIPNDDAIFSPVSRLSQFPETRKIVGIMNFLLQIVGIFLKMETSDFFKDFFNGDRGSGGASAIYFRWTEMRN